MKALFKCASALALLCAACASAAAQRDECKVLYYWVEPGGHGMSNHLIGEPFLVAVADERVSKSFRHEEPGLTVRVTVEYFGEPRRVRLALALAGREAGEVRDEDTAAEAETFHAKDWRSLSVSRTVAAGARRYTYTLNCTNEKYSARTLLKKRAKARRARPSE